MICNICGDRYFVAAEYRAEGCRAPALECSTCRALILREEIAGNDEERRSVKIAMGMRSALAAQYPDIHPQRRAEPPSGR